MEVGPEVEQSGQVKGAVSATI